MPTPPFSVTADEQSRIARIDELVASSDVAALIAVLSDPSWTVRRAAVAALAALGDDSVEAMCTWLASRRTNEHAIAAANDALAASIGTAVTGQLVRLATSPNPAVVEDAARLLGRRRAGDAVELLVRLVAHPSDNVALAAIEALGEIGGAASLEVLIDVIRTRNFFRAFPAMQVAARTGDPRVVAPLAELLDDDAFRVEAARALGRTGSPLALAPLAGLLADPDDAIVQVVASAVDELLSRSEWAGSSANVVDIMREVLRPTAPRFISLVRAGGPARVAAIRVAGVIGDATTVAELASLLDDPEVRDVSIAAIQRLVRADDAAVAAALARPESRAAALPAVSTARAASAVCAALGDDDAEVRARACEALARIGDTSVVPALFRTLADPSPRVAHAATAAIDSLGATETPGLAIAAVTSSNPSVRRQALRIIAYLGCTEAFDVVRAAIDAPDVRLAELAVAALAALGDDHRIDDTIVAVSSRPVDSLRAAAMRAAGQRAGDQMIALLVRGLGDPAPWVRYYACQSLGRLGHAASTDRVIARLADPMPHVRIAAIETLAHFDTPAAWQALARATSSADPDEKRAALIGIADSGRPEAVELLVAAASDGDLSTRLVALSGLARTIDPRALGLLAAGIRDPSPDVREAALSLVAERTDRAAAEILVDAAVAAPPEHPAHAALSRVTPARLAAITDRLLGGSDGDVGPLAAALARMNSPAATRALFSTLGAPNPAARLAAATALVAIGADGAQAAVRRLAADDPDLEVRRACAAAIGD